MTDAIPGSAASQAMGGGQQGATGAADSSAQSGGASQQHPSSEWTKGWEPADAGIVEKRGWKSPQDMFKSYRNLEVKMSGDAEKIAMPKDATDTEAWNALYNKLGRPETADKYTFSEKADKNLTGAIAPVFHKAGVTQAQAAQIEAGYNEMATKQQSQLFAQAKDDGDTAMRTLENEWGKNTPREVEYNRRAMRAMGVSVQEFEQAALAMGKGGTEKLLRLLNAAGHSMKEDNAGTLGDDESLGFSMSPNRAAADLQALKEDKPFWTRYMKGDKMARAKVQGLHKIINGEA